MENFILPSNNYNVQFIYNAKDIIQNNISNQNLKNEILNNLHPIYDENNKAFNEIKTITNIIFDIISQYYDSIQPLWEKTVGYQYVSNLKDFVFNSTEDKRISLLEKYGISYNKNTNVFSVSSKSKYNNSLEDRINFLVLDNYLKIAKYNIRKVYSSLYKENVSSTSDAIDLLGRTDSISNMTNTLLGCNRIKIVCKSVMSQESAVLASLRSLPQHSDAHGYVIRGRKIKIGTKFKLLRQSSGFGKHHSRKTADEIAIKIYDENNKFIDSWEHISFSNVVICKF